MDHLNRAVFILFLTLLTSCSLFNLRFKTISPKNVYFTLEEEGLFGSWEGLDSSNRTVIVNISCTGRFDLKIFNGKRLEGQNKGGHVSEIKPKLNTFSVKTLLVSKSYYYSKNKDKLKLKIDSILNSISWYIAEVETTWSPNNIELQRKEERTCKYIK